MNYLSGFACLWILFVLSLFLLECGGLPTPSESDSDEKVWHCPFDHSAWQCIELPIKPVIKLAAWADYLW